MKILKWHIDNSLSYGWAGGLYFIVGGLVIIYIKLKELTSNKPL